jgi:hypothetical protein
MGTQNYLDPDGLFRQYGTDKAVPTTGGDFLAYGANRILEVAIDLTTLTSTAAVQANTLFMASPPAGQLYIEKVEVIVETGSVGGTSFSVGLIQQDRSTIPSNYSTAFVNALVQASTATAGVNLQLVNGSTSAGGLIGTQPANATGPYYISALAAGTYTAGKVRIRVHYHGIGVITQ